MNIFAQSTPVGQDARCLVVDDFEAMRKITANQLRQLGVEHIESARNGAEALRLLHRQRFDVVLSDWNMPVMSGIELLQAMRADPALSAVPFILITAEAERKKVEEAIACGVTSMLLKPYSPRQLALQFERALHGKPRAPAAARSPSSRAGMEDDTGHPPAAAPDAAEAQRFTILIVDDMPDNLLLQSQLFKGEYRVRLAQTGAKALEVVASDDPPDLLLLDVMMPEMDGFDVLRRIREHPGAETIPVIFVSAMASADARLKGLNLGAVDYVTKPIDPEMLQLRVRNFMRYVQLRKNLQAEFDAMIETAQLREDVEHITRHDLKAPLAGALGMAQALIEDDSIGRRQVEQLRLVEEGLMQALNIVNQSAELYKIETGRFVLHAQPVPIGDLLRRIAAMDRIAFAEKGLSIVVDADVAVGAEIPLALADPTLCYSAFQNLLKNACEAAPAGSKVTLQLQNSNPLRIIVSNLGAVPAAIRERFFDKFVTAGKPDGTGLGTYSAKLLLEAQQGTIALEVSDAANLTQVTVTLPRVANA